MDKEDHQCRCLQRNLEVQDTGIHPKVDEDPNSSREPQQRSERKVGSERACTCQNATTQLLHHTNSKSVSKSLANDLT